MGAGRSSQLREGLGYIRGHREIRWSLVYLAIAASLVGVPRRHRARRSPRRRSGSARRTSSSSSCRSAPGSSIGILLLNAYGRLIPRRRVIEGGLIALGHPPRA